MKTALDWLIEQMPYEFKAKYAINLFQKAKELEKEQIINAFNGGRQSENDNKAIDHYNFNYNQNK